jgi:glycosyltransferase involved in cell wall biosynthesis
MSPIISVIVPAFNERGSIAELHSRIQAVFDEIGRSFELIFVDDGSSDGTFELIKDLQSKYSNIVLVRHFKNRGKSLALMQGFDVAQGAIAITMDADLQDLPEDIPLFINKIEEGFDFVNGWRQSRKDSFLKRMVSKVFNGLIHLIFKVEFDDINCGFKAYRRNIYDWVELRGDLHRLIPVIIVHKGHSATQIPVTHQKRKHGLSKYKLLRHRGLLDILALAASQTTYIRPFHLFSELGVFFWLLTFLIFGGWFFSYETLSESVRILLAIFGCWTLSFGTFLPIFGFYLEIESSRFQGKKWRQQLVKDFIDPRV